MEILVGKVININIILIDDDLINKLREFDEKNVSNLMKKIEIAEVKNLCYIDENEILKKENSHQSDQIDMFLNKCRRTFKDKKGIAITDPNECFEILLKDQFDDMRKMFIKKIDELKAQNMEVKKEVLRLNNDLSTQKDLKSILVNKLQSFDKHLKLR